MRSKKLLVAAVGSAMLLTGCASLCDGGIGLMCLFPAVEHYQDHNYHKVKEYAEKGCELGQAGLCSVIGDFYLKGIEVPESAEMAFSFFEKGCNLGGFGSDWACASVGEAYFYGRGVKKSKESALKYFQMANSKDGPAGHYGMGLIYEDGYKVKQSYVIAAQLYKKACDGFVDEACYKLGRLHEKGMGVTQSYLQAKEAYTKACNFEIPHEKSCNRLAYINKKGLAKKEEQAAQRAAEAQQKVAEAQRKAQSNVTGNALAQIVDAAGQYQSQQMQHTQNMTQMYRNATRDLQTNTIQPMNFNMGSEVYYGQRINDNMMSIQRVR